MSKIKWNDDRIRQTLTALLLLARARLERGDTADLIARSLADYRDDPVSFKRTFWDKTKAAWADPQDLRSLKTARHVAYYRALLIQVGAMAERFKRNQVQFNSVVELDNYLVTYLKSPDS